MSETQSAAPDPQTSGPLVKPTWDALTDHQKELLTKYEIDYHSATPEEILAIPPSPDPSALPSPVDEFVSRRGLYASYPLKPEQVAAVNAALDYSDKRPLHVKLKALGVTMAQWNNWKKNPHFNAYHNERAEGLIDSSIPETHAALLSQVSRGNMRAIEFNYQLTGRFDPRKESEINVQATMVRLVEAIQRHVKDPEVIKAIAAEFQEIGPGVSPRPELEN